MTVEEVKANVIKLPISDLKNFSKWFEEYMADQWDRQIETDVIAGRLNAAAKRADEDFLEGRVTRM